MRPMLVNVTTPSAHRWFNLDIERPELPSLSRWYEEIGKRPAFRAQIMTPLT
jgi:glutathione S-transferase